MQFARLRPAPLAFAAALSLSVLPQAGPGGPQERENRGTPEAGAAEAPGDAQLEEWRLRLLETAYGAASAMPLFPHVKNRSRAQEEVVVACLELDLPARALAYAEGIENWRKGASLAAYAFHCAEAGFEDAALAALERADEISKTSPDAVEQGWRRDRIQAGIARTHLQLGAPGVASAITASMETQEAGSVEAMRARTVDPRALDLHLERVSQVAQASDFDLTRNALATCVEFYGRFYDEAEKRERIEARVKASWTKLPIELRIDLLCDMSGIAAKHGDKDKAVSLVDEADAIATGFQWTPEHGLAVFAGLARARFVAGDPGGAKAGADAAFVRYSTEREKIVDVFRAGALRPLAEAYQVMGSTRQARDVYRMALEEGVRNPNSRPRSEDLTATLCSMALHGLEPTAGMWQFIEKSRRELGDPW